VASAVLFDTDVLIDAGRGVAVALDALNDAAKKRTLAISAITEMELIVGCRTALTENLVLVSKNQRDYRFIGGLQLPSYPPSFT